MSGPGSAGSGQAAAAAAAAALAPRSAPAPAGELHGKPFKLRFAARHDLGRSYISPNRPLKAPDILCDKFYSLHVSEREYDAAAAAAAGDARLCRRDPRDYLPAPVTSSQEYGWHQEAMRAEWRRAARDPGAAASARHHVRDSAWLKARAALLAHDRLATKR